MVGMLSDKGNLRTINEDYLGYFEEQDIRFYAVADGMGGHKAGEVASELAIKTTLQIVKKNKYYDDLETILKKAIMEANDKIFKLSKTNDDFSGMGTTITACLIRNNEAVIANVGDSSCIAIKNNDILKITKDHSLVQELIDNGNITEEEAQNHPNKNVITRALGIKSTVKIDIFNLDMKDINKFILCTDGVTNKVSLDEIHNIIKNNDEDKYCRKLVELSKQKGSTDNISVIVFEGVNRDDWNYTRK